MKYRKLLALMVVVFAVALSVPGCGKGGPKNEVGGQDLWGINGFTSYSGYGQATVLSRNSCYNVYVQSDGSLQFPITQDPNNPYYVQQGHLIATAYVASGLFASGNHYSVQTQYGDKLHVYLYNDQYFSGYVYLSPQTVKQIQLYLNQYGNGRGTTAGSLCIDGLVIQSAIAGSTFTPGGTVLYVNNTATITF